METSAEGPVAAYPTPQELWDRTFALVNPWRDRLAAMPWGGAFEPYYYQEVAVERALEAIVAGDKRLLLTLATGTGKTYIAFQIAWKLFQSRWSLAGEPTRRPRILFLADRNIVKQFDTTLDQYEYQIEDAVLDGDVESGKTYTEKDFNRTIEIEERERHRVQLFLGQINPNDKTLVFCATQDHALLVRDLINQLKSSHEPDYCARVTAADGERGNQYLREFQDNEKTIPTILTTSQKLSTGVDARNVRNIVLMRTVGSIIEFKQIIGRGTRLFEGKDYFTIFDFVKAHAHFQDPEWDGEPIAPEPPGEKPERSESSPDDDGEEKVAQERPQKLRIKLGDGKERDIAHTMMTTYWHADGTPMTAQGFMTLLFDELPEFFQDEAELRALERARDPQETFRRPGEQRLWR